MNELFASVFLTVACAVALSAAMGRRFDSAERRLVWLGFALHIVSSIAQVLVTKYYYGGGDMFLYYNTGEKLAELVRYDLGYLPRLFSVVMSGTPQLPVDIIGAGTATGAMSGITAIFLLFTADSLFATCIAFGLVAYSGQLTMFLGIRPAFPREYHRRLLMAALFVPSVVFWSSAILKEPFAVGGVGWVVLGFRYAVFDGRYTRGALIAAVGFVLIALVKPYILFPLAIALGAWWYFARSSRQGKKRRRSLLLQFVYLAIAGGVTVVAVYYLGKQYPRYAVENLTRETAHLQSLYAQQEGGSTIRYGAEATEERQLSYLPLALLSALFRPLPFDVRNAAMLISALEMMGVIILFLRILASRRSRSLARRGITAPTVVFMLTFVLLLGAATGLGAPNLGSLSRYRIPMMPFYLMLLLVLSPPPRRGGRGGGGGRA